LTPRTCHQIRPLVDRPEAIFGRKGEGGGGEGGMVVGAGGTSPASSSSMPFKTTVYFDSHRPMMAIPTVLPDKTRPPPGLKWYRRNSRNNPSPLGGGGKRDDVGIPGVDDEQPGSFKSTWLYRYWYIVLPMAIMMLFGGTEEEGGGTRQQQERASRSGGGGVIPAVSAGAAAPPGSGAKQRRGKRD
jgi:hypothetical protein